MSLFFLSPLSLPLSFSLLHTQFFLSYVGVTAPWYPLTPKYFSVNFLKNKDFLLANHSTVTKSENEPKHNIMF